MPKNSSPVISKVDYKTALFFLLNATVGVGYITLPKICTYAGLVNTTALMLVAFLISSYGSIMILRAYHLYPEVESYTELAGEVLGKKFKVILTIALVVQLTWTSIVYIHINFLIVLEVLRKWFGLLETPMWIRVIRKLAFGYVVWRLLLYKRLQSIRWFGYLSNLSWACFLLVLVYEMPRRYHDMVEDPKIVIFGEFSLKSTTIISNLIFAFANHPMLISVLKVLKDSKYTWVSIQVHIRTQQIALICYSLTICFAYLQFGHNVPGMILLRSESPDNPTDVLMTVAQIMVFFGITINVVNYTNASLDSLTWFVPKDDRVSRFEELTDRNKYLIFWYIVGMTMACFLLPFEISPLIDAVISILSPIYMVLIPGLMNLKLSSRLRLGDERVVIKLFMFFVTLSMIIATYLSVKNILEKGLQGADLVAGYRLLVNN